MTTPMIAIIDYEGGNLTSVQRALRHVGFDGVITKNADDIAQAERLIFPGVGAAGASMEVLNSTGLTQVVKDQVLQHRKPFLAICVGIQILFEHSEEDDVAGLGILQGKVKRFQTKSPQGDIKVPQIGWNEVFQVKSHPIFAGVPNQTEFYFVNSYYCLPDDPDVTIGECDYGVRFSCAVARGNIVATQFHLEKSGPAGLRMLKNFCKWNP